MQYLLDLVFPLVFNGIFLGIGGLHHPDTVWFSFAVINVSYLLILVSKYLRQSIHTSMRSSENMILIAHLCVQLFWGLICIFFKVSLRANIVVSVILCSGFAIAYLSLHTHNQRDSQRMNSMASAKKQLNEIAYHVKACMDVAKDAATKKLLERLYDAINCAQIADTPSTHELEQQVKHLIPEIETCCLNMEHEKAMELINLATKYMKHREQLISNGH